MSAEEIAEATGLPRGKVNASLTNARANHPGSSSRISRWQLQVGRKGRETPIYAAAPGKDADRPVFDAEHRKAANQRNYRANRARWAAQRKRREAWPHHHGPALSPWRPGHEQQAQMRRMRR
ncbi:hypothetical protein [Delftia sp.]|uniref:hypothetical protein n=1 Tax=Delftia sp. TaxID=1886637 RepID=UPI00259C796C|nr:hypothetical protein [Delftia sp.]